MFSYSKIETFNWCAKKYQLHYIEKIQEPYHEQGVEIHTAIKQYIDHLASTTQKQDVNFSVKFEQKENEELFDHYKKNFILFDTINSLNYRAERSFIITNDFHTYEGSYDENGYLKFVVDLYWIYNKKLYIVDWKSGKNKVKTNKQLEIYAWGLKLLYPQIEEVHAGFYYLRTPTTFKFTKITNFEEVQNNLFQTISDITNTKEFPETNIGNKCAYCFYYQKHCQGPKQFQHGSNNLFMN